MFGRRAAESFDGRFASARAPREMHKRILPTRAPPGRTSPRLEPFDSRLCRESEIHHE